MEGEVDGKTSGGQTVFDIHKYEALVDYVSDQPRSRSFLGGFNLETSRNRDTKSYRTCPNPSYTEHSCVWP